METLREILKRLDLLTQELSRAVDEIQQLRREVDQFTRVAFNTTIEKRRIDVFVPRRDGEPKDTSSNDLPWYPNQPEVTE